MGLSQKALSALLREVPCREDEISVLDSFISMEIELLTPSLVVHGYKSVGKSYTVGKYLETLGINRTTISCDECVSKKLLLQRCLKRIIIDSGVDINSFEQNFNYKGSEVSKIGALCETFASFISSLESFVRQSGYIKPHILVLERFSQCMDDVRDLLPAFLRLREQSGLQNISVIFILNDEPTEIATSLIPRIYFRPYTQNEAIRIIQDTFINSFSNGELEDSKEAKEFIKKFAKLVVDLYFAYSGPDINLLKDIGFKLWPSFVSAVLQGKFKFDDFIRIYREKKDLFTDMNVIVNSSVEEFGESNTFEASVADASNERSEKENVNDLPNHSKFILIASYLASYNEPKNDLYFFSKLRTIKEKKKKENLYYKAKKSLLVKSNVDSRLFSPNYFDLERLQAILSVIYRNESQLLNISDEEHTSYHFMTEKEITKREKEVTNFSLNKNIDVNSQVSALVSLGLLNRTSASDILSAKIRWKCNISWQMAESLAKDLNFPLQNYIAK